MEELSREETKSHPLRKQRSMPYSLHGGIPGSARSVSDSPFIPQTPTVPLPRQPRSDSLQSSSSGERSPGYGQPQGSNEPYRSISNPSHHLQNLRHKTTESSRLRALNNGYNFQSTDVRPVREASQPENFSRPRQSSMRSSDEPPQQMLQGASTFPLQSQSEASFRTGGSYNATGRVFSTSSSKSTGTANLRPGTAVENSNHLRDLPMRSNGIDGDEIRASLRSALTNTSSYLDTSGTERSSVLTRSTAETSIYGRDDHLNMDQGMSVDDAIGMYEAGFEDSGDEDEATSKPESALTPKSSDNKTTSSGVKQLTLPVRLNTIIRDSAAIFQTPLEGTNLDEHSGAAKTDPSTESPARSVISSTRTPDYAFSQPPIQPSLTNMDPSRDRYGFKKASQYVSIERYEVWNGPYTEFLIRRKKKWIALLKDAGLSTENPVRFPPRSAKVKRFVRKGIPPDWRGAAWFYYAGGPAMIARHPGLYLDLVQSALSGRMSATDEELIERDLNRTFPDNIKFRPEPSHTAQSQGANESPKKEPETPIVKSLRRVLQAFSIYNPKIGYCQSLNFLAGLLLLFMDEEQSFWLLNIITRVYLPGTHEVNLEGANVDLGVLMISVKESMPAVWAKIGGELDGSTSSAAADSTNSAMRLPPITLCCTAWFMSCYIGTLPIETTLRVWDSFFYEGSKTLFRIALAIFKVGEQEIRAVNDPMEIFQVVQTIPRKLIDASALMEACFKRRNGFGHLSQETIESRRAERRAGYAMERAAAAGVPLPTRGETVGRKNTLFKRRRGRTTSVEAPV